METQTPEQDGEYWSLFIKEKKYEVYDLFPQMGLLQIEKNLFCTIVLEHYDF